MTERQRELLRLIEQAFKCVEPGDGIGLHESVVIDDRGGPEGRRAVRSLDEKHDWRKLIDDPELRRPNVNGITGGGMCFFDAEGIRFYLPAYLSVVVMDPEGEQDGGSIIGDLLIHLTSPQFKEYNQQHRFTALNTFQRSCVAEVLRYLRDVYDIPSNEWRVWDIERAIEDYWATEETT